MRHDCRRSEDFDSLRYCQVAAAVVGSSVVGAVGSSLASGAQADAAQSAADAQSRSAQAAADAQVKTAEEQIAEARRQFDSIQKLLAPYTNIGPTALAYQQNIMGLNGNAKQAQILSDLAKSPEFLTAQKLGEDAILQNASATGGLRGGGVQRALSEYRPLVFQNLLDKYYSRLGGLTTLGQNSAAGVGSAGQNASGQIIAALGQQGQALANAYNTQGAAQAGNALAQGSAQSSLYNGLGKAAGYAFGALGNGTFDSVFKPTATSAYLPSAGDPLYSTSYGGNSFSGVDFNFNPPAFTNGGFTGYGA